MKAKELIEKIIWTRSYNPFIMGGNPHAPLGCKAKGLPVSLGMGFKGLVVTTPKGNIVVAELETGAIVGKSVEQVKEDIRESGDKALMQQQIEDAKVMMRDLRVVSAEEFWGKYERDKS